MTDALRRCIARLQAEGETAKNHPDLAQRMTAEFVLEVLPVYLKKLHGAARDLSAMPTHRRPDVLHAMTTASCMICCNIVQNMVGMLAPSLDVSRDEAFKEVERTLLEMMKFTHQQQLASPENLERSTFINGEEVAFDFRDFISTKGEGNAQN